MLTKLTSRSRKPTIFGFTLFVAALLAFTSFQQASAKAVLDFDGDGKTDYAVIRFSDERMFWFVAQSSGGVIAQQFGMSKYCCTGIQDSQVPEDYDGDGKTDIAVYRPGDPLMLFILSSKDNAFQFRSFPGYHNLFMTQDFDGDGIADPTEAYFELGNPNLIWRISESKSKSVRRVHFGNFFTDRPIKGDFDGDGKADIAVYRNVSGTPANTFFILNSSDGEIQTRTFGNSQIDYVIYADFDGDRKTDIAVWRGFGPGSDGTWYWVESSTGAYRSLQFGLGSPYPDYAAPGDYDGDGKTDQTVVRREFGQTIFYVNLSTGGIEAKHWGFSDTPLGILFSQQG
jgi:hypothetical protein